MTARCGICANCLELERVKRRVLACANPPFSHADQGVVELWNEELERLPCLATTHIICGESVPLEHIRVLEDNTDTRMKELVDDPEFDKHIQACLEAEEVEGMEQLEAAKVTKKVRGTIMLHPKVCEAYRAPCTAKTLDRCTPGEAAPRTFFSVEYDESTMISFHGEQMGGKALSATWAGWTVDPASFVADEVED